MVHSVQKGDTVVTQGGILGKVTKVIDGNEVQIEIADGVKVKIVRSMIAEVRGKSYNFLGHVHALFLKI